MERRRWWYQKSEGVTYLNYDNNTASRSGSTGL
jgi:hypothetical protein